MTSKDYFLRALRNELGSLSLAEQESIIEEYLDIFKIKQEEGQTEEEIVQELGDPKKIASSFLQELGKEPIRNENYTNNSNNTNNNGIAKFILFLLLDIFIFIPLIFSAISAVVGLFIAGVILIVTSPLFFTLGALSMGVATLMLIFAISFGIVLVLLMVKLGIFIVKSIIRHINWMRLVYGGQA